MKKQNTTKKQRGFFDLGISLIVLAIGGGVTAIVTPDDSEMVAQVQPIHIAAETNTNQEPFGDVDC